MTSEDSHLHDLYQQVILDHGRKPRNRGRLPTYTHAKIGHNPLCGDELTLFIEVQHDRIQRVGFEGQGCAIFMASTSLMTEALQGKTIAEAQALFEQVHTLLVGKLPPEKYEELGKLQALQGVSEFPIRVKCAALAWRTLEAALHPHSEQDVSTE